MNGAQHIAAQLQAQGIGSVFALAGASHTHLLAALEETGTTIISHRHESGAVGAADGYSRAMARATPHKIGVALIVRDQGLANAVGALAVAQAAGSPLVVLVAALPPGFSGPGTIDHKGLAVAQGAAKWCGTVPDAASLPACLARAFEAALGGRPGPVVLAMEQQLFLQQVPDSVTTATFPQSLPSQAADIAASARLLDAAERPLAIAGIGALRGQAGAALRELAARGIPVLGNGPGRGLVPEDDASGWSWPMAQIMAREADCVLVVGEVLSQRLGFGLPPRFSPNARMILVRRAPAALAGEREVDAVLGGETGATLKGLLAQTTRNWDAGWLARGLAQKQAALAERAGRPGPDIHPLALGKAIAPYLDGETMLVDDGADIANWMYGALRVTRPGGFMDHYPLGAMGSGTALAVGAAAALAEEAREMGVASPQTVLVTGDGAIGFHPGELHAAALAGLNLKVIVGNDGAWGTEKHDQEQAIGRSINTELGVLPYAKLGEAFGCAGFTCDTLEALPASLAALFAQKGPALLDVRIDRAAGAELKTNPLLNSILFSDLEQGERELAQHKDQS